MGVRGNFPTFKYITVENLVITHNGTPYPIKNFYTNKKYVVWNVERKYQLEDTNIRPEESLLEYLIIINDNGKPTVVDHDELTYAFDQLTTDISSSNEYSALKEEVKNNTKKYNIMSETVEGVTRIIGSTEELEDGNIIYNLNKVKSDSKSYGVQIEEIKTKVDDKYKELRPILLASLVEYLRTVSEYKLSFTNLKEDTEITSDELNQINNSKDNMISELERLNTNLDLLIGILEEVNDSTNIQTITNAKSQLLTLHNELISLGDNALLNSKLEDSEKTNIIKKAYELNTYINTIQNTCNNITVNGLGGVIYSVENELLILKDSTTSSIAQLNRNDKTLEQKYSTIEQTTESITEEVGKLTNTVGDITLTSKKNVRSVVPYYCLSSSATELVGTNFANIQKGDLIFQGNKNNGRYKGVYHVAIYYGNDESGVPRLLECTGNNIVKLHSDSKTMGLVLSSWDSRKKSDIVCVARPQSSSTNRVFSGANEFVAFAKTYYDKRAQYFTYGNLNLTSDNFTRTWRETTVPGVDSPDGLYRNLDCSSFINISMRGIPFNELFTNETTYNSRNMAKRNTYPWTYELPRYAAEQCEEVENLGWALAESEWHSDGEQWTTSVPENPNNYYIWSKNVTTYTDGTHTDSEITCISNDQSADGKSIVDITDYYYESTSPTETTGGEWTAVSPRWSADKYVWNKKLFLYDDDSTSWTTAVCVSGTSPMDLKLEASTYVVPYDSFNIPKMTNDITLTATQTNFTDTINWFVSPSTVTLSGSGNTRTISPSSFSDIDDVMITIQSKGLTTNVMIVKIKDGAKGQDGTSVKILGSYETEEELNLAHPNGNELGDGYMVAGNLHVWNGSTFENVGQIKGEDGADGKSSHMHIKYSNDGGKTFTANNGEDIGEYIGTCVNYDEIDPSSVSAYKWAKFLGDNGQDAYTVLLTNSSHTFVGDTSAAISGSTNCGVVAYKGATQVNATIGSISGLPTGMSISISNNNSKSAAFNINVSSSMTTKSGTLNIPVTVEGKLFNLIFSYSLALKGSSGADGSNAKYITVSGEQIFKYTNFSDTPTPSSITLSAVKHNMTDSCKWQYKRAGETTWYDITSTTGTTYSVVHNNSTIFNSSSVKSVTFRYISTSDSTIYDEITIVKVSDGESGRGISSITEEYYLSTSKTTQTGGSWITTPPTWSPGKYIWTRSKTIYTDSSTPQYTTPICDSSWEAVNEMNIGIRNLLRNTAPKTMSEWYPSTGWTTSLVNCTTAPNGKAIRSTNSTGTSGGLYKPIINNDALVNGESYTVSAWVRASKSCRIAFKFEKMTTDNVINISTEWQYITFTSKINTSATNKSAIFYVTSATCESGMWLEVHSLKLEKGDKATDWTPAPEDAIKGIDVMYYLSTSQTSLAGGSWSTTAPQWVNGKYMWSKTVTLYNDGTTKESEPTCIAGAKGDTGNGVENIVIQYAKNQSTTTAPTSGWSTSIPIYEKGYYLWYRTRTKYTDNADYVYSTATCDTSWKSVSNILDIIGNWSSTETISESFSNVTKKVDSITQEVKRNTRISQFRYIRDYIKGNTVNGAAHWVELQVYKDDTNIAKGKIVTCSGTGVNLERITDGSLSSGYAEIEGGQITTTNDLNGFKYIQLDLGQVYTNIQKIKIWHYYTDNRAYYHKLEVSKDGNEWYRFFDSDKNGLYQETVKGKTYIIDDSYSESQFEQTADKFNWIIKSGTSSSTMTLTDDFYSVITENIRLKAKNISIEGLVTANSKFKILTDGSMEAVDGKFKGSITGGSININDAFKVSSVGKMTATGADISGKITITDGSINLNNGLFRVLSNANTKIGGETGFIVEDYARAQLEFTSNGTIFSVSPVSADIYTKISEGTIKVINSGTRLTIDDKIESNKHISLRSALSGDNGTGGIVYLSCNGGISTTRDLRTIEYKKDSNNNYVFRHCSENSKTGVYNGTGSYMWNVVYAINGVKTSSDRTMKENIKYLDNVSNHYVDVTNELTTKKLLDFIVNDYALTTYNYIGSNEKKLSGVAQDIIVNADGTDNTVGQLIVDCEEAYEEQCGLCINQTQLLNVSIGAIQELYKKIGILEGKLNGN